MHHVTTTPRMRLLAAVTGLLLLFPALVWAQQRPFVKLDKFQETVSFRTNVCERQKLFWDGKLAHTDALNGLNLSVAITNYPYPNENLFFSIPNGHIPEANPGLFAVILDEVAKRAGFTWRDSFAAFEPIDASDEGKTWTDLLQWQVENFDISMEYWGKSAERMSLGVSFPQGWFPGAVILVESIDPSDDLIVRDIWSFLTPFNANLWGMIFVAIVFTGFTYWGFERLNKKTDKRGAGRLPFSSIFLSAITFTGHFNFWPGTTPAQILTFSWAFWSLIVMSSYTANLASFLVARRQTVFSIKSLDHAVEMDRSICLQGGTWLVESLRRSYPELRLVEKASEQEIFEALSMHEADGGCDAAVTQEGIFEIYERTREVNSNCFLKSEKRIVQNTPAGLATAVDTGNKCTSLISSVLDYHLFQMASDGFFDHAWQDHVNKISDVDCSANDMNRQQIGGGGGETTFSLGLADMGGVFILHAICSGIAIWLAAMQSYFPKMAGKDLRRGWSKLHLMPPTATCSTSFKPATGEPDQTSSTAADHDISLSSRSVDPDGHKTFSRSLTIGDLNIGEQSMSFSRSLTIGEKSKSLKSVNIRD